MLVRSQMKPRRRILRPSLRNLHAARFVALRLESLEVRRLLHAGLDEEPLLLTSPLPEPTSPPAEAAAPLAQPQGALNPLASVPALHSYPGAKATLYLDFNGFYEAIWGGYVDITTPAMDFDGDPTTFSDGELQQIEQIWAQVSEDYAPFDIDVTTVEPASFADGVAMRVAIGGSGDWYHQSAGGVGYVNSFTAPSLSNTVYVFSSVLHSTKNVAEASSHEAGHSFGLRHQSEYSGSAKVAEYYSGPGDGRAPIMGNSYAATRGMWWYGTSTSAATYQDDLSVLSDSLNGFGYRPDDHGDSPDMASPLVAEDGELTGHGVISETDDRDYFEFDTGPGTVTLTVTVPSGINNLDSRLELRDASDALIVSSDPGTSFGATITTNLTGGSYRVVVGSHGGYADVGQYTVTVEAQSPRSPARCFSTPTATARSTPWNPVWVASLFTTTRTATGRLTRRPSMSCPRPTRRWPFPTGAARRRI